MIITCPNCQSRYEVEAQALGARGRKVECANCHSNWRAMPDAETGNEDQLFSSADEQELDAFFEAEEASAAGVGALERISDEDAHEPLTDEDRTRLAERRKQLKKRQEVLKRNLPRARLRRAFRMAMAVSLMTIIGGGIYLREPITRSLPDMAGVYAAMFMPVNVIGIEFDNVHTLRTLRDGASVLQINANLVNIRGQQTPVPPVRVSLLNEDGGVLYEWSVVPRAHVMQADDWLEFTTQLTSPPEGAARLRLSFLEHPLNDNGGAN